MSNSTDKLSSANRALVVGAIAGGCATIASQWKAHQSNVLNTNELVNKAALNAVKSGAIAGTTTYVAEKMAGRPVLSILTILSVGAAGLYLMDQASESNNEQ